MKSNMKSTEKGFTLLPPPADACQECAVKHDPQHPHNQGSLFYQYHFYGTHGRWPTWKDAMDHCTDKMKALWIQELSKHGIKVPCRRAK